MITLGVTGGIGSGKSYVCKLFAAKGIPIYDSDSRTKQMYRSNDNLKLSLVEIFGKDILISKGGETWIDTKQIANKIFTNNLLMNKVKDVVYPIVMQDFRSWRDKHIKSGAKFVILESAVLVENEIVMKDVDKVLSILAPIELRIERVVKRDNVSREEVLKRINSQWTDHQRLPYSDYIIQSGNDLQVQSSVNDIYNELIKLSVRQQKVSVKSRSKVY